MPSDAPPAQLLVDGLAPSSIVEPSSIDELATALRDANEHGAAVIPWGAGRHMSIGNIPARYDVALRTTKLDRVIAYEPADMTVTVEAGITMGRLQSLLAERGQFLPIDAPADATVGGVLSAGVSGPSRHAYGLPRDWLIGCRIVLADGTIVKGGGRVVKNVAGYDIPKLVVGSLGTLGVIVEATFKLAPAASGGETLIVSCSSIDEAARLVFAADERSLALRAVAVLRPFDSAQGEQAQDGVRAAFWHAGANAAAERTRRELAELCGTGNAQRLEGAASIAWWTQQSEFASAADGVTFHASLLPSNVAPFLSQLSATNDAIAYPTTGLVLVRLISSADNTVAFVENARRAAASGGGSLVVTSAPRDVKQRVDVWGDVGSALPLMRSLKQQFDPKGTLNPGRFVGGI